MDWIGLFGADAFFIPSAMTSKEEDQSEYGKQLQLFTRTDAFSIPRGEREKALSKEGRSPSTARTLKILLLLSPSLHRIESYVHKRMQKREWVLHTIYYTFYFQSAL